jgi:lipopolysaccharide/colanic/teichoic acid biosynthesis glycosyltransferase
VWNVFWGDMSLVGPRPIVDEEIGHYGSRFKTYLQVKPGLTGLWQISGRNNLDYPTRVRLDDYYVRNWSIWFDLYILARTPSAMLTGTGAY